MAFTSCTVTVTNIADLSDTPNITDGLSASLLKAKFDLTGSDLKNYINTSLVTVLNSTTSSSSGADNVGSATISGVTGNTVWSQINSLNTNVTNLNSTKLNLSGGTLTGALVLTAATAALPALTTTGDTDTGIYFPAANNIAITTGGTQRVLVDNTNTTLSNVLKLTGGSVSAPSFSNTGDNAGIYFPTSNVVAIATASSERLRINGSGDVGIGTTSPSEKLQVSGNIRATTLISGSDGTATNPAFLFAADSGMGIFRVSTNILAISTAATERMRINASGDLILAGSVAQKASGTAWSNPSDVRLKENISDYEKGLKELMQIEVKKWEFNGKANTVKGTKSLGVIADEIEKILPDMVSIYQEKLNEEDEFLTDIKKVDSSEITWLLVKTIQEQQTIIDSLKQRIESLESKVV